MKPETEAQAIAKFISLFANINDFCFNDREMEKNVFLNKIIYKFNNNSNFSKNIKKLDHCRDVNIWKFKDPAVTLKPDGKIDIKMRKNNTYDVIYCADGSVSVEKNTDQDAEYVEFPIKSLANIKGSPVVFLLNPKTQSYEREEIYFGNPNFLLYRSEISGNKRKSSRQSFILKVEPGKNVIEYYLYDYKDAKWNKKKQIYDGTVHKKGRMIINVVSDDPEIERCYLRNGTEKECKIQYQ